MLHRISGFVQRRWKSVSRLAAPVLFALSWSFAPAFAQQPGQRTFGSAQDAGDALFAAMQTPGDASLLGILGPAGEDIVSSGDPTEESDHRVSFVVKYQEMHRFVREPNRTVTLVIGAEHWPFPIPLVNDHGSWYFDTPSGKDEILFRRVGQNELAAIDACRDLVEAHFALRRDADVDERHHAFIAQPVPINNSLVAADDPLSLQAGHQLGDLLDRQTGKRCKLFGIPSGITCQRG